MTVGYSDRHAFQCVSLHFRRGLAVLCFCPDVRAIAAKGVTMVTSVIATIVATVRPRPPLPPRSLNWG